MFGSFLEVLDWTKRFLPSGRYGNIIDALSLLEILSDEDNRFQGVMKTLEYSRNGGFETMTAAKVVTSFTLTLPSVLGHWMALESHAATEAELENPLLGLKSESVWSNLKPLGGKKERMLSAKETHARSFQQAMTTLFPGEAFAEARALMRIMHQGASEFFDRFTAFITDTNREVTIKFSLGADEAWLYTCTCTGAIVQHLQEPLAIAHNAMEMDGLDRCVVILWASLGCYRRQQEFLEGSFERHPCLAPHINLHLFKHRVPRRDFAVVQAHIEKLKGLPRQFDILQNKVAKKQDKA